MTGLEPDLPVATATSLELHGTGQADRTALLAGILGELAHWYLLWRGTGSGDAAACGLRAGYLRLSATVGRRVRIELAGGQTLAGTAEDVGGAGQLLVRTDSGEQVPVSAGDVIHLR